MSKLPRTGTSHHENQPVLPISFHPLNFLSNSNSYFARNPEELWLAVFSGSSGKVRWKQPLSQAAGNKRGVQRDVQHGLVRPAYADLDGDGTLDMVLSANATPQADRLELRASSGADGKILWKRPLAPPIDDNRLLQDCPIAVTGDLDGDGKPEVIVLEYFEKESDDPHEWYHARQLVLDGADGMRKWPAWETKAEPCSQIISGRDRTGLWNLDVNGDGSDELLLINDEKVQAIELGVETPLWQWPVPAGPDRVGTLITEASYSVPLFDAEIIDVLPGAEDRPPVVAVRRENAVCQGHTDLTLLTDCAFP